jgi:hypothetical protein
MVCEMAAYSDDLKVYMMVDCLVQPMVGEKDIRLVAGSVAMKGVWKVASKERQRGRLTAEK